MVTDRENSAKTPITYTQDIMPGDDHGRDVTPQPEVWVSKVKHVEDTDGEAVVKAASFYQVSSLETMPQ